MDLCIEAGVPFAGNCAAIVLFFGSDFPSPSSRFPPAGVYPLFLSEIEKMVL